MNQIVVNKQKLLWNLLEWNFFEPMSKNETWKTKTVIYRTELTAETWLTQNILRNVAFTSSKNNLMSTVKDLSSMPKLSNR